MSVHTNTHDRTGDMPIEMENKLIKESVVANITHELIAKVIRQLNFTWVVHRALDVLLRRNRKADSAKLKNIDKDKDMIKYWLRKGIGNTYAKATKANDANLLGLDMSRWGGDRSVASKRLATPWAKRARKMADYDSYIRGKLRAYCHWHRWQPRAC